MYAEPLKLVVLFAMFFFFYWSYSSTYYDQDPGVEVLDGCSCAGQEAVLPRCWNHHRVQFGHLLQNLHAHSSQSGQVRLVLVSWSKATQRNQSGLDLEPVTHHNHAPSFILTPAQLASGQARCATGNLITFSVNCLKRL